MQYWWSRWWFPLSLSLVGLFGLAGAAVLLLHLLGIAPSLGGLTSLWTLPLWAGIVVLLLPVLLLLLYFLKLRRKAVAVPSTFLWRKSIADFHVNSLIQWLRKNQLLVLQLLTLFVFLFALLALQVQMAGARGEHYIILLDNSASMAATDVRPSRLEQAKEEALALIDARKEGDAGMVIAFNSRPEILQPRTTDRALLRKAVRQVQQTQGTTRLDEALARAEARANIGHSADDQAVRPEGEDPSKARTYVSPEPERAEVHLFSDGGFPDVHDFALGNLSLRYHRIGKTGALDNVGIVSFSTLRDQNDARLLHVFAEIIDLRADPGPVKVRLEVTVDGVLHGVHEEMSRAGTDASGRRSIVAYRVHDVRQRANVVLHAQLVGIKDVFPLDDLAWLVVGMVRKARVALVRPGRSRDLEAFLEALAEQGLAEVTLLSPGDLTREDAYRKPARDGVWDLVLFERCAPAREADLPQANTFFIGDVPPPWQRSKLPVVKYLPMYVGAASHPLMKDLSGLQGIPIGEAFVFDLEAPGVPGRPPRLLETKGQAPLLFPLSRRPYTDLVMTFQLNEPGRWNCDWPLHFSFPLFLKNVVFQLGNIEGDEALQPGAVKRLRPKPGGGKLEVLHPAGKSYTLNRGTRADVLFDRIDTVGVYSVMHGGKPEQNFAVNLLDPRESDLSPRDEFSVGSERVAAGATGRQVRDLWKFLAAGAFLLLLLEWYVYNRRVNP